MTSSANDVNITTRDQFRFTIQYNFTETCNLRCKHCYGGSVQRNDKPLSQLCRIIDHTVGFITREWQRPVTLALTGGEPFASSNLFPILSYLHEQYREDDVLIQILSNGTLITEENIRDIKTSYPMVKEVQISLDGVRQHTHESIRGKGTYHKALQACELLVKHGIRVAAHMVVTNINYSEAFELTDLGKSHGFSRLTVTRLVPIGRGQKLSKLEINPAQVRELYSKLNNDADMLESSAERMRIARWRCDWPVLFTPPEYKVVDLRYPFKGNGGSCAIGSHMITVLADGSVLACQRLPIPVGNVLKDDFKDIWNHPFLWKIRLRNRFIKGKCERCEFMCDEALRFSCGGGGALCINHGQYGDVFRPDIGCTYEPAEILSITD